MVSRIRWQRLLLIAASGWWSVMCSETLPVEEGVRDVVMGDAEVRTDIRPPGDIVEVIQDILEIRWDLLVLDKTSSDTGVSCTGQLDPFGCVCEGVDGCASGWCELHLGERVCSSGCVEDCPSEWECNL